MNTSPATRSAQAELPVPPGPGRRRRLLAGAMSAGLALGVLMAGLAAATPAAAAPILSGTALTPATAPVQIPGAAEERQAASIPMSEVIAKAVPARTPIVRQDLPTQKLTQQADGKPLQFAGAPASATGQTQSLAGLTAAASGPVLGSVWPGAYYGNPNRQVGKLFFDADPGPGVKQSSCTATAIYTANKSFVLTAGHCVFNSDPDNNQRVDGNGYYYKDFRFCPGFETSCKLGTWYYRLAATTPTWYYGSGANHVYDPSDDIGVLLMKPNASGYLVNVVGGQGISFNQASNQMRTAFGYPAPDSRFPPYQNTYNGLDLIYCQGTNSLSVSRTKIWMPCRMTGGASGGPWLTTVNAQWIGYVNSVNSHKPYGAEYMEGPYFGSAEATVFNMYKSA